VNDRQTPSNERTRSATAIDVVGSVVLVSRCRRARPPAPNLASTPGVSLMVICVMSEPLPVVEVGGDDVTALFRAHYARLVRALAIVCGDAELAADAVQEAFVRAHSRWRSIRHYDDPVGWVRHVALNLLRDDRRRSTRMLHAMERLAPVTETTTPAPPEPDGVTALLETLPRQQRVAAALFYVEGLSIAEVATAMGIAEGSVKSHLHDARRSLRTIVAKEQ
jgi:RNA polymerase sigma-70 factor, ECF subfamily